MSLSDSEEQFVDSLPREYREAFGPEQRRQHAAWAAGRAPGEVRGHLCARLEPTLALVLALADDREGLIAEWADAFLRAELSLEATLICTRRLGGTLAERPRRQADDGAHAAGAREAGAHEAAGQEDGAQEAVDFFWVRAPAERLQERVGLWLQRIAEPAATPLRLAPVASVAQPKSQSEGSGRRAVTVEVKRDPRSPDQLLVSFEAAGSDGLARAVAHWAAQQGLSIVGARLRTLPSGWAQDDLTLRDLTGRGRADPELAQLQTGLSEVIRAATGPR